MSRDGLPGFEFQVPTRLCFGPGQARRAGELARAAGITRALLVTDPGVRAAGHADRVRGSLEAAGLLVQLTDAVAENPTTEHVERVRAAAAAHRADGLVAVGGGSAIDVAKGANLLYQNGGRMQDYRGKGTAPRRPLPLIALPTTAGTGSEVQSYALIAEAGSHEKMACGDAGLAPVAAILDPELTLSLPPRVTALTALDALVHAVETAVTRARSPLSIGLAEQAFPRIVAHLPRVLDDPGDLGSRGELLLAACLAGLAIENSMLGVAHSLANPLTARHSLPHGQAVATVIPVVVRFNGEEPSCDAAYGRLLATCGRGPGAGGSAGSALANLLWEMLGRAGLPLSLEAAGLPRSLAAELAPMAAAQWTAGFNPRTVGPEECQGLYDAAWRGPVVGPGSP